MRLKDAAADYLVAVDIGVVTAVVPINAGRGHHCDPGESVRKLPLPVAQFQMVQESAHRITLYYVGDRSIGDIGAIRGLRARVRQLHSDRGELRLRKVNKIETGRKFQVFLRSPELAGGLREPAPAAGGEEDVASEVP